LWTGFISQNRAQWRALGQMVVNFITKLNNMELNVMCIFSTTEIYIYVSYVLISLTSVF